jgi:hypothetical protein
MVDRACIGKCFAYANYEPSSKQFRIRVNQGSPIVTDSEDDSDNMEKGYYVVRPEDLPMNQIYQCDEQKFGPALHPRTFCRGREWTDWLPATSEAPITLRRVFSRQHKDQFQQSRSDLAGKS